MKAQERHELKENDLASWFQYGLPLFLKRNGSYIMLVLALCLLGWVLWQRHVQNEVNTQAKAWMDLEQSAEAEDKISALHGVIDTYDIKEVRQLAYLKLADAYQGLAESPLALKSQGMSRSDAFTSAYETYQKVLSDYGSDNLIAAKAMIGMAAVEEDRDEWDQAKKVYEEIADKKGRFAGTPMAEMGEKLLNTLDDRRDAPRLARNVPTQPATNAAMLPGLGGSLLPNTTMPGTAVPPEAASMPGIVMPSGSPFNGAGPVIPPEATTTTAPGK